MIGISFTPVLVIMFMTLAAIYDHWAVNKSKHMLELADTMIGLTYNVPISDPVGGWAQGGYMIYPHLGNGIIVYDGPTSKGQHTTLDNNTQIWQIRVNINSRVELVKNGTVFFTFDSPSATAWSG